MTWDDVYVLVTVLSFVGLLVLGVVWVFDRWRLRRRWRADVARLRMHPEFREMEAAFRRAQEACGTPLIGPVSRAAERVADVLEGLPSLPGTVQCPSDPSPRPRRVADRGEAKEAS